MKRNKSLYFLPALIFLVASCMKNAETPIGKAVAVQNGETIVQQSTRTAPGVIKAYENFYDEFDWKFTNSPAFPSSPPTSWVECGYSSNGRWARVSAPWSCPLYPGFASVSSSNLILQVPGNSLKGAQVETIGKEYFYGSYRAKIKTGTHSGDNSQGTVNGFFFYNGDNEQEIDIEVLSHENQNRIVHFTTHPPKRNKDHKDTLLVDPSKNYIEYGFDWYTDKINFFINGKLVDYITTHIPNTKGRIILNHWTGDRDWGGTPPPIGSDMKVDYVWHAPFVLVTYPDVSGITWSKGSSKIIKWNTYGDAINSKVTIELWKDGNLDQTVKSNAPNTGSYTWKVPNNISSGNKYQILIKSNLNSKYFDYSNNAFSIQ